MSGKINCDVCILAFWYLKYNGYDASFAIVLLAKICLQVEKTWTQKHYNMNTIVRLKAFDLVDNTVIGCTFATNSNNVHSIV